MYLTKDRCMCGSILQVCLCVDSHKYIVKPNSAKFLSMAIEPRWKSGSLISARRENIVQNWHGAMMRVKKKNAPTNINQPATAAQEQREREREWESNVNTSTTNGQQRKPVIRIRKPKTAVAIVLCATESFVCSLLFFYSFLITPSSHL